MRDQIHETVVKDVVDLLADVKDSGVMKDLGKFNKGTPTSYTSIAKKSSELTLTFPVIVSKSISIDTAIMTTKAIERKCTSMLQMVFNALQIDNAENGIEYLKKFHGNLSVNDDITIDSITSTMDSITKLVSKESTFLYNDAEKILKEDALEQKYYIGETINDKSLNEYVIYSNANGITVHEVSSDELNSLKAEQIKKQMENDEKINPKTLQDLDSKINNTKVRTTKDLLDTSNARNQIKDQLLPSDIKKANELVPTMMVINFIQNKEGSEPIPITFVCGVKAKMYPVDSSDMITRIVIKNEDKNFFKSFIKATTGEISFFKDFIFAVDKAKMDAIAQSRKGSSSKLWKFLERRATMFKRKKLTGKSTSELMAITTLVISQNEVEALKKDHDINIMNPAVIRPIMSAYNLMGVCVVDETMETVNIIFDTGDDIYETLSFNSLEREASDNSSKKVVNLMSKLMK